MIKLLKADIRKIIHDKLTIVALIIISFFAIVTPLLYKVMNWMISIDAEQGGSMSYNFFARDIALSSFALGSNVGLIVPIFAGIIVCKEFSFGTIRNRLIKGYSKLSVYLVNFISTAIFICSMMLISFVLTLGISCLLFKFQSGNVNAASIGSFMLSVLFSLLIYVTISAIVTFLAMTFKNIGLTIVCFIAITIFSSLLGSLPAFIFDQSSVAYSILNGIAKFVPDYQMMTWIAPSSLIGSIAGTTSTIKYGVESVLYIILSSIVYICSFVGFGALIFKRRDVK